MTMERFCDLIATAHHVYDLYTDGNGQVNGDLCGIQVVHNNMTDWTLVPQVQLTTEAFDEVVEKLHLAVDLRNNDPERLCAEFAGVMLLTVISMEEAAARGYLVGAENEFYSA